MSLIFLGFLVILLPKSYPETFVYETDKADEGKFGEIGGKSTTSFSSFTAGLPYARCYRGTLFNNSELIQLPQGDRNSRIRCLPLDVLITLPVRFNGTYLCPFDIRGCFSLA